MQTFIATFYSHFGAIRFKKTVPAEFTGLQLMPVPRDLSSSCGTCVRFQTTEESVRSWQLSDETEKIVRVTETGYIIVSENV
ncbi:MAG: DUF3343 domain-containing protein [Lachnospiraceae bacterium]|nr:DUF3343 domain-containing protein [Lachnospiraceae bacterium]MDY5742019.1 DUF3343 domain-containing protein [Lachnospiraceae bacterium]